MLTKILKIQDVGGRGCMPIITLPLPEWFFIWMYTGWQAFNQRKKFLGKKKERQSVFLYCSKATVDQTGNI